MVYWVDDGSNSIGETGLTGAGTGNLVTTNVGNTADLALDLINDQVYWTNTSTGQLWRANLSDGSGVINLNIGGTPYGLALDPVGNKTYWMDSAAGELYRVNLSDGSGRITLYSGLPDPRDVDFFSLASLTKSITAPTATNLNSTSVYTEGDASVPITDIVVTDVDFGEIITASLTLANTSTGILSANDGATYNPGTGVWTIKGTVADVNTALANLVFNPTLTNELDTSISVSIDDGDEDGSGPLTGTITLDVTPAYYLDQFNATSYSGNDGSLSWSNDWQEIGEADGASPGSVSVWNNLGETGLQLWSTDGIGAWREADLSGATSATLSFDWAMLQTEAGDTVSLEISTDGGLSWITLDSYVGPLNHSSMQTASYDISAHIDNDTRIKFETVSGFSANDKFFIDNVRIDIDSGPPPINNAPTATNLSSTSAYNEGDPSVAVTDIVVSDVDTDDVITATLTLADTSTGSLSANDGATYTAGTGVWTITDTVANVNTALANLAFTPTLNNEADTIISVNIDDGDEDASGPLTGTINLNVTAVNDLPVATGNTVIASEDVPLVIGPGDFNFTDVELDSLASVTITGLNLNGGTLTHSAGAVTVTNGMTVTAAELADLTFTSALNDSTDSSFTYTVNDADLGITSAVMNITVNAVNDAHLLISTNGVALDDNTTTFNQNDIALFNDPDLAYELGDGTTGTTDGTFSTEYTFPKPVRAIHYVSNAVTVDTMVGGVPGTYDLQVGQVVLSMRDSVDFTLPKVGGGTITVNNTDLLVYSPGLGEYEILLEDAILKLDATPANIHAISIVEQNTVIGVDTALTAGTYILASSDPAIHANISTYNNTDGRQDLLLGADFMSDPGRQVQGA